MAVALTAQELGNLGLDGGLHEQAHAEAGHLLQYVAELPLGTEQVVYLGADTLDGRYSYGHGCGFLSLLARL